MSHWNTPELVLKDLDKHKSYFIQSIKQMLLNSDAVIIFEQQFWQLVVASVYLVSDMIFQM